MLPLVEPYIANLERYIPGKSSKEVMEEFGIQDLVKLASNENALGPSKMALEAISNVLVDAHRYPVGIRKALKARICEKNRPLQFTTEHVVLGAGSNELITLMVRGFLGKHETGVYVWPSFLSYRLAIRAQGASERVVPLSKDLSFDVNAILKALEERTPFPSKILFIANPNNPTGSYLTTKNIDFLMEQAPKDVIIVVDEAYLDYAVGGDFSSAAAWVLRRPRTVVLRTFSKIYGLAGLRVGYSFCDPEIAEILHRLRDPFNVNSLAQNAAMGALLDEEHVQKSRGLNSVEKPRVEKALTELGVQFSPGRGNFILVHAPKVADAKGLIAFLLQRGVIVRDVANYDLPQSFRLTFGLPAENDRFLSAMAEFMRGKNT